jgi:hypothetical protein
MHALFHKWTCGPIFKGFDGFSYGHLYREAILSFSSSYPCFHAVALSDALFHGLPCATALFAISSVGWGAGKVYAQASETGRMYACAKRRNIKWVLTNFGDEK